MKTRFFLCLLAIMFCLAATARADDDKPDPAQAKKGMTMAQVKKTYGDPASEATDKEHGTLWTYVPNRGQGFIPVLRGRTSNLTSCRSSSATAESTR